MSPKEILDNSKWNKGTTYIDQITFTAPDGFKISVPRSNENMTHRDAEEILIERVQALYQ